MICWEIFAFINNISNKRICKWRMNAVEVVTFKEGGEVAEEKIQNLRGHSAGKSKQEKHV